MKNRNLILGLLGGIAIGSILGVLFAPEKGSKTRKKLVDSGMDLSGNLKDTIDDLTNKITNTIENFKSDAKDFVHSMEEKVQDNKSRIDDLKHSNNSNTIY